MSQEIAERSTGKDIIDKIIIDRKQGVITFDLTPSDVIQYSDLPRIIDKVFKEFQNTEVEVVKITGRGPVWLYSAVVHTVAHLAKAVAVFDAVNKKYVVVVSHSDYKVGDTLKQ
ncbi:MAG: CRISPR-associated protein Csx3 [Ignisphaera sp.]